MWVKRQEHERLVNELKLATARIEALEDNDMALRLRIRYMRSAIKGMLREMLKPGSDCIMRIVLRELK